MGNRIHDHDQRKGPMARKNDRTYRTRTHTANIFDAHLSLDPANPRQSGTADETLSPIPVQHAQQQKQKQKQKQKQAQAQVAQVGAGQTRHATAHPENNPNRWQPDPSDVLRRPHTRTRTHDKSMARLKQASKAKANPYLPHTTADLSHRPPNAPSGTQKAAAPVACSQHRQPLHSLAPRHHPPTAAEVEAAAEAEQ
jgi:hypothetical protein